jgi:hypothetical protein
MGNLKPEKLCGVEVKQNDQMKILNRFAILENLEEITESDEINANSTWENPRDNVKISAEEV